MEQNYEQKLCFVPKSHKFDDVYWNEDKFLTIALKEGKVLSPYEFENMWLRDQTLFDNHHMKLIDVCDTTWEMCPHCETEVELPIVFEVQKCPVCGEWIAPCSICHPDYADCANCRLDKLIQSLNELRVKNGQTSD